MPVTKARRLAAGFELLKENFTPRDDKLRLSVYIVWFDGEGRLPLR